MAPAVTIVKVRVKASKDAVALGAPDVGTVYDTDGSSKPHSDCNAVPAFRSGITSLTNPPACTCPAVVNVTVALSLKPGVSVAVSNRGLPPIVPAVMPSVAIDVGPSITLPRLSLLVTLTVFASTNDDGVRTLLIVITCAAPITTSFVATTIVSVLAPASHVVDCVVAAPADGVVHDADGVSNDQGDCKPVSVGITISMLPPTWIVPVGVNDSVAVSFTPGVSVPVSNDLAPVNDPAAI